MVKKAKKNTKFPKLQRRGEERPTFSVKAKSTLDQDEKISDMSPTSVLAFISQEKKQVITASSKYLSTRSPASYCCSNTILLVYVWICLMIMISHQEPPLTSLHFWTANINWRCSQFILHASHHRCCLFDVSQITISPVCHENVQLLATWVLVRQNKRRLRVESCCISCK